MIKKWHPIYPSSKVSPETIENYGWKLVEEVPAQSSSAGNLVPIPEASRYLKSLRVSIDEIPTIKLATENEIMTIEDFAVARIPVDTEQKLGFFVLQPRKDA